MTTTSKVKNIEAVISCDRFNSCSANICPLDAEWQKRKHLNSERICFYLLEAQKINAKAVFECGGREYLYSLMQQATPAIISRHYPIKYALEKSKKTGLRLGKKIGGSHESNDWITKLQALMMKFNYEDYRDIASLSLLELREIYLILSKIEERLYHGSKS